MKYLILILLVGLVGCKSKKENVVEKKPYVIVNGDTVFYSGDSVFIINPDSMDYSEEIQSIDTIIVK